MKKGFYERFWESDNIDLSDFERKWPLLKKFIPHKDDVSILDFGCGKGHILSEMMKINPRANYVGFDVSETAIDVAKEKFGGIANFFSITDGGALPAEDNAFDFIISSEVFEHIYDTENAAKEVARILKPGGRILVTVPYHGFFKNLAILFTNFEKHFDVVGGHIRFFSKKSLSELFEKNGIKPIHYDYYGRFFPFPHSIVFLGEKNKK